MTSSHPAPAPRAVAELTSFVGRGTELSRIRELLQTKRLITLVGPGGVGKTRLALRAAGRSHGLFADGVCVVELAPLRRTDLLATVLMDALGLSRSSRPPLDLVGEYLRERSLLLVLDNCEHLAGEVGPLVEQLLCVAPRLRTLATSRQSLEVQAEHLFEVHPLPLPDAPVSIESAPAFPAVTLFLDRAAAAVPGFTVTQETITDVAQLCSRLEGIPLAIELAAVRLKVLSLRQLGNRLQDRLQLLADTRTGRPARHQTLRASLDWTAELCSPGERRLWAYGSLFPGGFTVEAMEQLSADADAMPDHELLAGLSGLVDKSVLMRTEAGGQVRFRMLETVREYGLELLEPGAERVRLDRCYIRWCADLVDDLAARWFSEETAVFEILTAEHANLRAAMTASLADAGSRVHGLRIAASLWFYWIPRAPSEGRQWLEPVLDASAADPPTRERNYALVSYAYILVMQGDRPRGCELLRASQSAAHGMGDELCAGYATHLLGLAAFLDEDFAAAADGMTEAAAVYGDHGATDGWRVMVYMHTGLLRIFQGETDLAEKVLTEARHICERYDEKWLYSYVLFGLAFLDHEAGNSAAALKLLKQCVQLKDPFDDVIGTALVLSLASWVRASQGDGERAGVAMGAARRLWQSFGMELYGSAAWVERRLRCEETVAASIGDRALEDARRRGEEQTRHEAMVYVLGMPSKTPTAATRTGAGAAPARAGDGKLSKREEQIATLVGHGLTNRHIAERLTLSTRTVDGHVQQVLNKLGFTSRSQIAAWVSARPDDNA